MEKGRSRYTREYLEQCSNKDFSSACIEMLNHAGKLDDRTIAILCDKEMCHDRFCCSGFPVLNEVSPIRPISDAERKDGTGRNRYYKEKVFVGKRAFIITNHWYGPKMSMPDNRTPFLQWVLSRIG